MLHNNAFLKEMVKVTGFDIFGWLKMPTDLPGEFPAVCVLASYDPRNRDLTDATIAWSKQREMEIKSYLRCLPSLIYIVKLVALSVNCSQCDVQIKKGFTEYDDRMYD